MNEEKIHNTKINVHTTEKKKNWKLKIKLEENYHAKLSGQSKNLKFNKTRKNFLFLTEIPKLIKEI